jgi:hypothetical protein
LIRYNFCLPERDIRAVQYLRKQAEALLTDSSSSNEARKPWHPVAGAQAAAQVLKKMLTREDRGGGDDYSEKGETTRDRTTFNDFNPAAGWSSPEISINSSHSCLLINPSVVLHSDGITDATVVLVAGQASLQSYAVVDNSNAHDPVNGRIMSRQVS